MKSLKNSAVGIALIGCVLFAVGCSNSTDPSSSANRLDEELLQLVGNSSSTISDDGVLFAEFDPMSGDYFGYGDCDGRNSEAIGGRRGGHHGQRGRHNDRRDDSLQRKGKHRNKVDSLGLMIKCLQLTGDQSASIETIKQALHLQVHAIVDSARAQQRVYRDSARAQARIVRDQFRAKTITRDEAHIQLDAIRAILTAAVEPIRTAAQAQAKAARDAALLEMRAVLTPDQQAIWDNWLLTGVIPC